MNLEQVDKLNAMRANPVVANNILKPVGRFAYWMDKLGLKCTSELDRYLAAIHNTTPEEAGETLDSISEVLRADWERRELARMARSPNVIPSAAAPPMNETFAPPYRSSDANLRWTVPDSVPRWAKVYQISRNTMTKHLKEQTYRNRKVGRLYEIAVEDLPAREQHKHLPATP
jgi:hypothetical protein